MKVRRSLVVLALLTLSLPVVVFGWRANQARRAEDGRTLQFHTVGQGQVVVSITALGQVEAEAVAGLSFITPGRVVDVLVEPGDSVRAGDVLARLASESERIEYDQAVLALQLAELKKEDLLEPADDSAIRIAEAKLNSAWGAYLGIENAVSPEDLQAAQLRYDQALAAVEDATEARTSASYGQPEEAYALLDARVGEATFNAEIARLQLEALQNGNSGQLNVAYARVVQAQRELEQVQAGATQAEIDSADLDIAQAQAEVDAAALALSRRELVAPFDGMVSAVNVEVGAMGTAALTAIELTDVDPLHVLVEVDEIDIRQVREGLPALVRLDALPDVELDARIEQIALVGTDRDGIISYDVRIALDETDPRVRAGMTAEAAVILEERQETLVVPNEYIRLDRNTGQAFVNRVGEDGQLTEVEVTLGLQGQDTSEVVAGLDAGDVLAVDVGSDRLSFLGG